MHMYGNLTYFGESETPHGGDFRDRKRNGYRRHPDLEIGKVPWGLPRVIAG